MKADKDKELCEKYPKIFADRQASILDSCMAWGFECGDGWVKLIDVLCQTIQNHIDSSVRQRAEALERLEVIQAAREGRWEKFLEYYKDFSKEFIATTKTKIHEPVTVPQAVPQVVARQIKEKYGTLSFYYSGGDSYIDGAVSLAVNMSAFICEVCGAPGELATIRNWLSTRCRTCRETQNEGNGHG